MMPRALIVTVLVVTATALVTGCNSDPVHDKAVDDLGGETPGIPKGPHHRAGQPCLVCHGGDGPASSVFSLAGTVYQFQDTKVPLEDGLVRVLDSAGRKHEVATNCAGNFFVMRTDFEPKYPAWVKLVYGHQGPLPYQIPMTTPIYRQGSCGACHGPTATQSSEGPVYLFHAGTPVQLPTPACSQ
jgi:hypothetical protein